MTLEHTGNFTLDHTLGTQGILPWINPLKTPFTGGNFTLDLYKPYGVRRTRYSERNPLPGLKGVSHEDSIEVPGTYGGRYKR